MTGVFGRGNIIGQERRIGCRQGVERGRCRSAFRRNTGTRERQRNCRLLRHRSIDDLKSTSNPTAALSKFVTASRHNIVKSSNRRTPVGSSGTGICINVNRSTNSWSKRLGHIENSSSKSVLRARQRYFRRTIKRFLGIIPNIEEITPFATDFFDFHATNSNAHRFGRQTGTSRFTVGSWGIRTTQSKKAEKHDANSRKNDLRHNDAIHRSPLCKFL